MPVLSYGGVCGLPCTWVRVIVFHLSPTTVRITFSVSRPLTLLTSSLGGPGQCPERRKIVGETIKGAIQM